MPEMKLSEIYLHITQATRHAQCSHETLLLQARQPCLQVCPYVSPSQPTNSSTQTQCLEVNFVSNYLRWGF